MMENKLSSSSWTFWHRMKVFLWSDRPGECPSQEPTIKNITPGPHEASFPSPCKSLIDVNKNPIPSSVNYFITPPTCLSDINWPNTVPYYVTSRTFVPPIKNENELNEKLKPCWQTDIGVCGFQMDWILIFIETYTLFFISTSNFLPSLGGAYVLTNFVLIFTLPLPLNMC